MNLQEIYSTAITETVAAVMDPSMAVSYNSIKNNNTIYSYDTSAPSGWSGDGGGGGGGSNSAAANSVSASGSFETGGDVFINSGSNYLNIGDSNINNTRHGPMNFSDMYFGEERCQNFDFETNHSYWNVTCDSPVEYIVPLYGYSMPFLLITTVLSNSLIVLILSKKKMSTPTNFVLMGMAIYDMLTVIFPAPGIWYMYTFGNHYKPLHPVSVCYIYQILNEIMPTMCHTASIWLTLALAVQRYIYVCHAPMAHTWCTMPRVKRCTLYITIAAFLHQSAKLLDHTIEPVKVHWEGKMVEVCQVRTASWVDDYIGEDLYYASYFLFRVIFVHLVPCIMLVTLNILLFAAMRQAQERRKLLFRENRKKECKKLRESNCTTLMLIVVVTVFLIVEIPIAVVTAMHIVSSLYINFMDYDSANILITFTNFFLVVSYPINFGIYCGMSRQFRETFKEIFLGSMAVKKDNSSKYSIVNGPRTCTNTNETVL
ncbi:sex peptide receptor [Calliphora vicina]|uniref:sex peptide receptor n=1 Tax=Calliphora vicina TaxID=7373 RepID=UPI00325AC7EF